jgi:hypothetical protein
MPTKWPLRRVLSEAHAAERAVQFRVHSTRTVPMTTKDQTELKTIKMSKIER